MIVTFLTAALTLTKNSCAVILSSTLAYVQCCPKTASPRYVLAKEPEPRPANPCYTTGTFPDVVAAH